MKSAESSIRAPLRPSKLEAQVPVTLVRSWGNRHISGWKTTAGLLKRKGVRFRKMRCVDMCGRYCLYDDGNEELRAILDKTEGEFKTGEIFPTDKAPILIQQNESIRPQAVAWGFPAVSEERASSSMPGLRRYRRSPCSGEV